MNARRLSILCLTASSLTASAALTPVAFAQTFDFTITQPTSQVNYMLSADAPATGTLLGNTAATPPSRLRTPLGPFFSCPIEATENDHVPFTGTITVDSASAALPAPVRPTGTLRLSVNAQAGTVSLLSASLNMLGGTTIVADAMIEEFSFPAFCAANPSCNTLIGFTIDFPLEDAGTVNSVVATQVGAPAAGTLTPVDADTWTFSIPAMWEISTGVLFQGSPLPTVPQPASATLTGTIDISGNTAAIRNGSLALGFALTTEEDVVVPPTPFTFSNLPVCNGLNVLVGATVTSSSFSLSSTASLFASGARALCPCDTDQNGTVEPADIFFFLNLWFAQNGQMGPNLTADFDRNGTVQPADIFVFLDCWFSRPPARGC